jgi:hypothetical protein
MEPPGWQLESSGEDRVWTRVDCRRGGGVQQREFHTFQLASPVECTRLRLRGLKDTENEVILHGFDVFGSVLD